MFTSQGMLCHVIELSKRMKISIEKCLRANNVQNRTKNAKKLILCLSAL